MKGIFLGGAQFDEFKYYPIDIEGTLLEDNTFAPVKGASK